MYIFFIDVVVVVVVVVVVLLKGHAVGTKCDAVFRRRVVTDYSAPLVVVCNASHGQMRSSGWRNAIHKIRLSIAATLF